jgi:hypothetical protein
MASSAGIGVATAALRRLRPHGAAAAPESVTETAQPAVPRDSTAAKCRGAVRNPRFTPDCATRSKSRCHEGQYPRQRVDFFKEPRELPGAWRYANRTTVTVTRHPNRSVRPKLPRGWCLSEGGHLGGPCSSCLLVIAVCDEPP